MITRVKMIIEHYGMSARAFSQRCGLKDNTFINQLNGVRDLSLTTIAKILLSFEDVSAEWLLRGKGSMLLAEDHSSGDDDRVNKLIDTIAFLQCTVCEQKARIEKLEEENKRIKGENLMLKNGKNII